MMEWITDPGLVIALVTLTVLEIVLGIDNIIFISILAGRLPEQERQKARILGLALAMLTRIGLLLSLAWVMQLTRPLMTVLGQDISGRDLILGFGGLFLLGKSTHEIHSSLEGGAAPRNGRPGVSSFAGVLAQVALLDIVFSLDSVITAVGMTNHIGVMVTAIVVAVICMMVFVRAINEFIEEHPTVRMLALSFLLLIGVMLIAEAFDQHIPKGYIYFAMAFSVFVEMLNLRFRKQESAP